jgi:hypothetical protein
MTRENLRDERRDDKRDDETKDEAKDEMKDATKDETISQEQTEPKHKITKTQLTPPPFKTAPQRTMRQPRLSLSPFSVVFITLYLSSFQVQISQ